MKKCKLEVGRKGQNGRPTKYDHAFKRKVALQYLEGNQSLTQIASEYGLNKMQVSRCAKEFSCELAGDIDISPMTEQEEKDFDLSKKQNEVLKKKLEYEQMKNFALETMIDLAKSELGIDLRKNSGAKQPKE